MKNILIVVALLAAVGAAAETWHAGSRGGKQVAAAALACSADGKTVYAADLENVWKSEDGGATWKKVTPKDE
jgi:hypothetical protein